MAEATLAIPERAEEQALIARALRNDPVAIRAIIAAHNRRLYRVARSILRHDGDAEDVLQEAYLRAFAKLGEFRGDSSLATWLTRIVLNEALQYRRGQPRQAPVPAGPARPEAEIILFPTAASQQISPEQSMAQREIIRLMERAIDALPDNFRIVLVARTIEGMSVEETAELLGLKPETVKTRLHRARLLLRKALAEEIDPQFAHAFPFGGHRCERIAAAVVARLGSPR